MKSLLQGLSLCGIVISVFMVAWIMFVQSFGLVGNGFTVVTSTLISGFSFVVLAVLYRDEK